MALDQAPSGWPPARRGCAAQSLREMRSISRIGVQAIAYAIPLRGRDACLADDPQRT